MTGRPELVHSSTVKPSQAVGTYIDGGADVCAKSQQPQEKTAQNVVATSMRELKQSLQPGVRVRKLILSIKLGQLIWPVRSLKEKSDPPTFFCIPGSAGSKPTDNSLDTYGVKPDAAARVPYEAPGSCIQNVSTLK